MKILKIFNYKNIFLTLLALRFGNYVQRGLIHNILKNDYVRGVVSTSNMEAEYLLL